MWATLADLVLPNPCAACGCRDERLTFEVCAGCVGAVQALRAGPTRPSPAPEGLPPCFALGEYGGELRELILGFKERGRHRLAHPLGALLAEVIAIAAPGKVTVVYIPDTAAAARQRHGDHMRNLAQNSVRRLRMAGRSAVVVNALRARADADSAHLDSRQRWLAAQGKFAVRRPLAQQGDVVLVDDIITTGNTLAAASHALDRVGVSVRACVALAATQRNGR